MLSWKPVRLGNPNVIPPRIYGLDTLSSNDRYNQPWTCQVNSIPDIQRSLFNTLNRRVIPLIKKGCATPRNGLSGLVLLETRGRVSGKSYEVPVAAAAVGDYILVGTVRSKSQWMKNLDASDRVDLWIGGERKQATVNGFLADKPSGLDVRSLPFVPARLAACLHGVTRRVGASFAILEPEASDGKA